MSSEEKMNQDITRNDDDDDVGENNAAAVGTAAAAQAERPAATVTTEELIDLVRAVKFAHPEASIRNVHREISEVMSQKESFEFLKQVKLNDVKKVWKKANYGGGANNKRMGADVGGGSGGMRNAPKSSLPSSQLPPTTQNDGILKLYTVGVDGGSIQSMAQEYTNAAAAAMAEAEEKDDRADTMEEHNIDNKYVHVFLDVPADQSGKRPHQALINFSDNSSNSKTTKRRGKASSRKITSEGGGREIVKIQVAAAVDSAGEKYPMLLYNQDRSARTFIHPRDDDDDGYDRIHRLILQGGSGGALGQTGGTKAYFYSRITQTSTGPNVISIDVESGLAPLQAW